MYNREFTFRFHATIVENIVDPKVKVVLVNHVILVNSLGRGDMLDCSNQRDFLFLWAKFCSCIKVSTAWSRGRMEPWFDCSFSAVPCEHCRVISRWRVSNVRKIMKTSSYYNGRARKKDFCSLGHVVQAYWDLVGHFPMLFRHNFFFCCMQVHLVMRCVLLEINLYSLLQNWHKRLLQLHNILILLISQSSHPSSYPSLLRYCHWNQSLYHYWY